MSFFLALFLSFWPMDAEPQPPINESAFPCPLLDDPSPGDETIRDNCDAGIP